jgi:8-oxo-dGTP diphosphatase
MVGRSVSVLVLFDSEGKFLLQHRTHDAPTYPNYWAFFGGGLEDGETPRDALRREILEELDYATMGSLLYATHTLTHQDKDVVMHVFVERYDGSPLVLGEGQGMGWFTAIETAPLLMIDHDRAIISALVSQGVIREFGNTNLQ